MRWRHMISPRITQNSEPPSMSSAARLGTMRVRWMCSGFSPRLRFSRSFSLIQSSRSRTESAPTQSLMRLRAMVRTLLRLRRFDQHDLGAFHNLRACRDGNLSYEASKRRAQRVLHLHSFNNGETLAGRNLLANTDQHLKNPAMHRRLDKTIAGTALRRGSREIPDAHARLA